MTRILLFCFFLNGILWSQEPVPAVKVIARSLPNKVLLRWAVDQPLAWKKANEYGFNISRATIARNGTAVVPIERKTLLQYPLKPKPLEEWEELAISDQNVAVLAQALFGDSFETTAPSTGALGSMTAINDQLEQRFTFALLAAEQNYAGAKLAGWGFEDETIVSGENYVYTITVSTPLDGDIIIEEGSIYIESKTVDPLPKPIDIVGIFNDQNVMLSWNFTLLNDVYTSYFVERSEDGQNFQKQNRTPLFNASKKDSNETVIMYYTDSIPNNKKFFYRVKGKTAFGETSPASEIISGKAIESLKFVPRITNKQIPDDNTAIIKWEFKEEGNAIINGFELRRGNKVDGPFTTVEKDIPPSRRETTFKGLKRINYFTVVAMGKNGVESPSFATIVQPVDSIPPSPPKGLVGIADTLGVVKLEWIGNTEEDFSGYRLYRSYNKDVEFSEVTIEDWKLTSYIDTIAIANLNKKVFYKLKGMDQRYNASEFSETLVVDKPDVIPPSPPVFKKYKTNEEGVYLEWIPSSSEDVVTHKVFRKTNKDSQDLWEEISVIEINSTQSFTDSSAENNMEYAYTLVAEDKSGLESKPIEPITVVVKTVKEENNIIRFNGTVNRDLRYILLSWKIKKPVVEFQIYRGTSDRQLQLFKTMDGKVNRYTDYQLEINTEYVYGLRAVYNSGQHSAISKIEITY